MKTLKLLVALSLIGGVAFVVLEWIAANRGAAVLKQTIAAQNKIVEAADADKRKRDTDLQKALAQIDALKRQVKTSAGAVRGLNQVLTLPQPITFEPDVPTSAASATTPASEGANLDRPPNVATIPRADLVPLYDYAQNCRACALQLDNARQNAIDDAKKIRALEAERDDAVKSSRGGSLKHRLKIAVEWFALGAGSGLVVSAVAPRHNRN